MSVKSTEYLIEKISKYYMVLDSDIDKSTVRAKMKSTMELVEEGISVIQDYDYPSGLDKKKVSLNKYWKVNKNLYANVSSLRLPSLLLISTDGFKQILNEISIYHSRGK